MTEAAFPNMRLSFAKCWVHSKPESEANRSWKAHIESQVKHSASNETFATLASYQKVINPFYWNRISTCRISAKHASKFKQASQEDPHQRFPWKQAGFKHSGPVIPCPQNSNIFLSCSYLGDLQRLLLLLAPLQPEAPRRPSAHSNAEIIPCAHFPGAVGQHSHIAEHEKLGFADVQRAGDSSAGQSWRPRAPHCCCCCVLHEQM